MSRAWAILYRLRDAREGIARNAWASLATVVLVALTLMMLGGFLWLNGNLSQLAVMLERQVQMRVFPVEGVSAASIRPDLAAIPGVESVDLVAGAEVYEQLAPVFGRETLLRALPPDAFPDSLSLRLRSPDSADEVIAALAGIAGTGEVIWGQSFAAQLYRITEGLQRVGVGLVMGFAAVAVLTCVTTMHLAILNRQTEIEIQHWVGVSPWGIRSQFLAEALLLGLLSALVAAAAFLYAGERIQATIGALVPFARDELRSPRLVIGIVMIAGPVLALLGGAIASHVFIRGHGG